MASFNGFGEFADELSELADEFDEMSGKVGRDPETGQFTTVREAIQAGFNDALDEVLVPEAKERAPKETGRLADSITHESRGWRGDTYRHAFGPTIDDEYARVQEFGTNKQNYRIEPNGDYPLSFEWDKRGGMRVAFAYVVHPGVEGSHYIERSIRNNIDTIESYVQENLEDVTTNR
jgi:hypothetical protein